MASNLVNINKRKFVTYAEPSTGSVQDSLDSRLVGLQDPTYLGFDIFFKFDNSDYLLQPGAVPLTVTSSVLPSLLYPQSDPEATVNYFKRINKDYSAAMLEEFKTQLKDISINYPWYFQTISGLGEILKRPAEGETIYLKDKVLTFECLESIDYRMHYLANLYRHFAYDNTWMRSMLPDNKKKFDCVVYVYEIRDLTYVSNIVDKLHKDINTPVDANTETNERTPDNQPKETSGSISQESQTNTGATYDYVSNLLNKYITFFKFSFNDCIFNFDDFASFDTIANNTMTPEQVKFKFSIIPGKLKEYIQFGYWDFVIDQKERTFKRRDSTNPLVYNTDFSDSNDDKNYQNKKKQSQDDLKKFINQASIFLANPDKVSISNLLMDEPNVNTEMDVNTYIQNPNVNTEIGFSPLIQSPNVKKDIDQDSLLKKTLDRAFDYGVDYATDYVKKKANEKIQEWKNKIFKLDELSNYPLTKITPVHSIESKPIENFENIIKNTSDIVSNINSINLVQNETVDNITKIEKTEANVSDNVVLVERTSNQTVDTINQIDENQPTIIDNITNVELINDTIIENISGIERNNPDVVDNLNDVNLTESIPVENISGIDLTNPDVVDSLNNLLVLPPDVLDKSTETVLNPSNGITSIVGIDLNNPNIVDNITKNKLTIPNNNTNINSVELEKPSTNFSISNVSLDNPTLNNTLQDSILTENTPAETITPIELEKSKPNNNISNSLLNESNPITNMDNIEMFAPFFDTKIIKIKLVPPSILTKITKNK